jgi:hypothetical protein
MIISSRRRRSWSISCTVPAVSWTDCETLRLTLQLEPRLIIRGAVSPRPHTASRRSNYLYVKHYLSQRNQQFGSDYQRTSPERYGCDLGTKYSFRIVRRNGDYDGMWRSLEDTYCGIYYCQRGLVKNHSGMDSNINYYHSSLVISVPSVIKLFYRYFFLRSALARIKLRTYTSGL